MPIKTWAGRDGLYGPIKTFPGSRWARNYWLCFDVLMMASQFERISTLRTETYPVWISDSLSFFNGLLESVSLSPLSPCFVPPLSPWVGFILRLRPCLPWRGEGRGRDSHGLLRRTLSVLVDPPQRRSGFTAGGGQG